jgi:hypothetical protein
MRQSEDSRMAVSVASEHKGECLTGNVREVHSGRSPVLGLSWSETVEAVIRC